MAKERQQLDRLMEEQMKALEESRKKIHQLKKYAEDYMSLQKRLLTLPDKITHNVMVPFGKLAFMPGQLVHTNEVLVLLGDNWFTERSAKQAAQIAGRRIKAVDAQISGLEKQQALIEPRLGFTSDMGQVLQDDSEVQEIKEEYNEEEDKRWRAKHRERVRAHRLYLRQQKEQSSSESIVSPHHASQSDDALWQRLEELERQERRNREMSMPLPEEDSRTLLPSLSEHVEANARNSQSQKGVRWKDEEADSYESNDESDSEEDGVNQEHLASSHPLKITFKHSPNGSQHDQKSNPDSTPSGEIILTSPADVYHTFVEPFKEQPKSILKSQTSFESCDQQVQYQYQKLEDPEHIAANVPEPFTGSIIERTIPEPESFTGAVVEQAKPETQHALLPSHMTARSELTSSEDSKSVLPPSGAYGPDTDDSVLTVVQETTKKRVSKFKASRQKHEKQTS